MRNIPAALQAHLESGGTGMRTCWAITRTDAVVLRFTDHQVDLVIDGDTYIAGTGTDPSAVKASRSLASDNMEIVAFIENAGIDEADVAAGLYDNCSVDVFQVNWQSLSMGRLWLARGWSTGEIAIRDNTLTMEVRSKAHKLNVQFIESVSATCRATLGDARCKVDVEGSAGYFHDGTVTSATDRRVFRDTSIAQSQDRFRRGIVRWITGQNAGFTQDVKSYDPATDEVQLLLSMPYEIQVGDTYRMLFGCDGSDTDCKFFNNIKNMRAELFVPGPDRVLDVALPGPRQRRFIGQGN